MQTASAKKWVDALLEPVLALLILIGISLSSLYSYLFFHFIAETFSVVIACGVFMVAWNARNYIDNNYLLLLGIASPFVAAVDVIHTLSYKGMGVFPQSSANLAAQLWIAARYLSSFSFLLAPVFIGRKFRPYLAFWSYIAVTAALFASIFLWKIFPVCFVEGVGQTPFKLHSEYAVCLILLGALFLLVQKRKVFEPYVFYLLAGSIVSTIASELFMSLYTDVYGIRNLLGHVLKIIVFYLLYKAVIETGLVRPYDLLFRDLNQSKETLAQRARELESTNQELEAFTYSVSHDLKTPLVTIEGYSSFLLEEPPQGLGGEEIEYLENIQRSSRQMAQMIDSLLNFSRASRAPIQRTRVNLSEIARQLSEEFQRLDPKRKAEFSVQDNLLATGDETLLRQVMQNLIGNAWKFTSKREVTRIEFGTLRDSEAGQQVFFVRDNGAGFDMAQAQNLFAPFERLHPTRDFQGTGIGLSTVQRIIARHNGRIWANAQPDQGATFFFSLPKDER